MTDPMSATHQSGSATLSPEAEAEMERLGITRVPIDYFHWREFRYTNLNDAIAQAKMAQAKQSNQAQPSAQTGV